MTLNIPTNTNTKAFDNLISMPQNADYNAIGATPQNIKKPQIQKQQPKEDFFDRLSKKVEDSKDTTDTVTLPRSIFKGYLCFFTGTTLGAIGGMLSKPAKGLSIVLKIASSALAILGTYEFTKSLIIRQTPKEEKTN